MNFIYTLFCPSDRDHKLNRAGPPNPCKNGAFKKFSLYTTVKPWPTERQQELRTLASHLLPYAMRYTNEAAQTLGLKDGKWETRTPVNPMMPRVNGGVDGGRPMARLQWQLGQ